MLLETCCVTDDLKEFSADLRGFATNRRGSLGTKRVSWDLNVVSDLRALLGTKDVAKNLREIKGLLVK